MLLERITLENFRAYRGRQTIDLRPAARDKPIVLVTGLNGTGKTTLLEALHLALYGKIAPVSRRNGRAYDAYLDGCIYDGPEEASNASVEVELSLTADGEKKTYVIRRSWSRTGKGVREELKVASNGDESAPLSEDWAQFIEGVLPSRLAPLFFFDGEKIETLADLEAASEVLSVAIHSLLGLDLVDQLKSDLEILERGKQRELKEPEERAQLDQLEAEVAAAKTKYDETFEKCRALEAELKDARNAWRRKEREFEASGGVAYETRRELEAVHQEAKEELAKSEEALRGIAGGLAPLLLVEPLLGRVAEQANREREARESRMLGSLLESRDTETLEYLREAGVEPHSVQAAAEFFEQDRSRRRRGEKVEEYLRLSPEGEHRLGDFLESVLPSLREQIRGALERNEQARLAVEASDHRLKNIPEEEAISKLREARNTARTLVERLADRLEVLENDRSSRQRLLEQKEKLLSAAHHRQLKRDETRRDASRMVNHSERVRSTLGILRERVLARHVDRIQSLVLDGFRKLLRKSELVADLEIDPADFSLRLYGRKGNRMLAQHLSAGERQLLAVSLLWGLARASGRPMPTLIDTPLGRLDSGHRAHLVERYFPVASHQVVLFSTDEEINGRYLEKLRPSIGRAYVLDFDGEASASSIRRAFSGNGNR